MDPAIPAFSLLRASHHSSFSANSPSELSTLRHMTRQIDVTRRNGHSRAMANSVSRLTCSAEVILPTASPSPRKENS